MMKKTVVVRDLILGEGIPKVCVPLVGKTREDIIDGARELQSVNLDLVEWRVDHYVDVLDIEKVKETLVELREILDNTPILFTFRSLKEGGEKEIFLPVFQKALTAFDDLHAILIGHKKSSLDLFLFKG